MSQPDPSVVETLRRPSNVRGLAPGLPMRGRIKAGRKGQLRTSSNGKEFQPPEKLPYFLVTTLERGKDGNFNRDEVIHQLVGEQPTEIPVQLLFDSIELNFRSYYGSFAGTKPWCLGNGEVALRQGQIPGLRDQQVECPCERLDRDYTKPDKCKLHGELNCVIAGAPVVGGVWKFLTTSWNSVQGILSSLALIQNTTGGRLAGIPLNLCLRPKAVTTPQGQSSTVYVASLEYRGTVAQLRDTSVKLIEQDRGYEARRQVAEEQARELLTRESQTGDDDAEDEDLATEFHPDTVKAKVDAENGAARSGAQSGPSNEDRKQEAQTSAPSAPPQAATANGKPKKNIDELM